MKIQPSVATFPDGELRFDAHEVPGDMLEPLTLPHVPICLEFRKLPAKNLTTDSSPRSTALPWSSTKPHSNNRVRASVSFAEFATPGLM